MEFKNATDRVSQCCAVSPISNPKTPKKPWTTPFGTEMILFVGVVVPISDTHCISYDEIRDRKSNCEQDQRFRAADAIHVFSLLSVI